MQRSNCPKPRWYRSSLILTCLFTGATLAWLLVWSAREIPAEPKAPELNDRFVAQMVAYLLEHEHLSKKPLDDAIAQRGLETYLKMLDPMKLYFRKKDVAEFEQERNQLDDMLKAGQLSFAYRVFDRYLQRLDERIADVEELVYQKHDYTIDEELVTDSDQVDYAATEVEAKDRWRRRIKYELMARKADGEDMDEAKEKIVRRYRNFDKRRHQTNSQELLEMYLTSLTSGFDPHTTYMSDETLENFHINMRLNLEGIGAALMIKDGYTVVTKIIPGGAADKMSDLKPEDRIVSVGQGQNGEMVDVLDMKLSDVVDMIRGKAGTVVRLGVIPGGTGEKQIYTITRAKIELKDAEARAEILEDTSGPDGMKYKVGVIDLPSFYMDMEARRDNNPNFKSTTRDVRRILDDFRQKDVDVVVLDLRRNGGGSLTEAINLTGLFIDHGPVVQVKDSIGAVHQYDDDEMGMAWTGPLVVVTSKFSASASEILAGAIQDYRRGIVVGDRSTHGKGTVQSLMDLGQRLHSRTRTPPRYGALKITMQQFYRPSGDSTQMQGVLADVALPSLTSNMDIGESDLDYALEFGRVKSALDESEKLNLVNPQLVAELRQRSIARQKDSEDFQELAENIARYLEQKKRSSVTLNEEKYLAERAKWDADKEEQKELEEQFDMDHPVFDRDHYYNQEILAVTLDYLQLLRQNDLALSKTATHTGS